MRKTLIVAVLVLVASFGIAQAQETRPMKIGYTNANYIFSISPRAKEIESEIRSRTLVLRKELEKKQEEFRAKLDDYEKAKTAMMESIRKSKENELRNLEQNLMELQQNAEGELKNKYDELVAPESDRIQKAIKDVAAENNFTYVINGDPQVLLYGVESGNITDLVLKKLGITPPPPGSENNAETKPNTGGNDSPAPIMTRPGATKPAPKKK
jgi:outer membrane protein